MIKGFTAGAFDLLHAGHVVMLEEAKNQCDFLIVGLHINPHTDRLEKNIPIQSTFARYVQLKACRFVNQIIPYDTEEDLFNLLACIQPDIRFMGSDWKDKPNYSRDQLPEMKVIYNSRKHDYSSSYFKDLIKKS